MRKARLRWLGVFLAGASAAAAHAQQEEVCPVVDDAHLRAVVAKVLPAVEKACGRTFRKPPTVGLADAGDVMRSLRDDLEPGVAAYFAGQPRSRIDKALQQRADLLASSLLGKYGLQSGEVYVLPHLVRTYLGLVHHREAPVAQVLELVVAHELVHALQDQEIGLGRRFRECCDNDANEALAMAIEGHAVFCSERVAAALGLQAAIVPLRAVFAGAKDPAAVGKADLATRRLRGQGSLRYLRSADWMAREHAAGGDDRLWQLLAEPTPRTRACLLGGRSDAAPCANLADCFGGLDARLAGRNWTVGRGSLSDRLLLGENLPRGADLEALLPALVGSGEWLAVSPTPASWRALYALAFRDAAAAEQFVALAVDVATNDMKDSAFEFTSEAGPVGEGMASRRLRQEPKETLMLAARAQVLWWRRGRHVLQATFVNAPVDDAALLAAVEAVFARLER